MESTKKIFSRPQLALISAFAVLASMLAPVASMATATTSDEVEEYRSVSRSTAAIGGNGTVSDTVSIVSGERLMNYSFSLELASNASNLVVANSFTPTFDVAFTKDGTSVTANSNYAYVSYTNTSNTYGSWSSGSLNGIPAGTYRDFRVEGSFSVMTSINGPAALSITYSVKNGSTVLVPLSFGTYGFSNGFQISLAPGGTYTANADDERFSVNYRACIWAADHTLATGDVIELKALNGSSNMTYSYGYVQDYAESSVVVSSQGQTAATFTYPANNNSVIEVSVNGYVNNPTGVISPNLSVVKSGNSTQLFDKCNRYTAFSAPTVTAGSTSVTVNWTAPAGLGASDWTKVAILACTTSLASCANENSLSNGMMGPNSSLAYTFKNSQDIAASATSYTVSSSTMNSLMMGGPNSSGWSAATQYKYYVVYFKASQYYSASTPFLQLPIGNLALSAVSTAVNASGVSQAQPAPAPAQVTAQVVRLPEWQSKAITSITKVIDQAGVKLVGGKIKLDGVTASDLKKVTLNGKEISIESLNPEAPVLNIPAGSGTGDLVFTLADGGTWTFQNAIRYVEPLKAGKPMKLFNFDAGSTTVNSYQVAQIAAQSADLLRGSTVECFGYVAKKNANTVARATAQAEAICAEALKINPSLKKVITVAVDEIMALQPNRIRVFG